MTTEITLNETWINGRYNINGQQVEVNTRLSYVAIGEDYFFQGQEADTVICDIHQLWIDSDMTVEQAIEKWINFNL